MNASRNFRLVPLPFQVPRLLRLHAGNVSQEFLRTDAKLRQWVFERGLFERAEASCLLPIRLKNQTEHDSEYFLTGIDNSIEIGSKFNVKHAQIFPLAPGDLTHYAAPSEPQLFDFARKFGRLQRELASLPVNLVPDIPHHDSKALWMKSSELKERIMRANDEFEKNPQELEHPFLAQLWNNNRRLIDDALSQSMTFWDETSREPLQILLHDVHPHNAFFRNNECVLIYDFAWVNKWRHADTVAYTLHRFVREWVRYSLDKRDHNALDRIPVLSEKFVDAYSEDGPQLPDNFLASLEQRVAAGAMFKLGAIASYCCSNTVDPWARDASNLEEEGAKFISFLREAKFFRPNAAEPVAD